MASIPLPIPASSILSPKNQKFVTRKTKSPRIYRKALDKKIDLNPFMNDLLSRRLLEVARTESLEAAMGLKDLLIKNKLNIVTAESLTAGMITKTLVDIPGAGATVYGGYVVYDTDAKRQFIQVATKGVYSILTAQQMAAGALERSRAMVGLAVSGDAMPFPNNKDNLGKVYIGVALRLADGIIVYGKEISVCDQNEVKNMCDSWKSLNDVEPNPKFPPYQYTSLIADYIRMKTVAEACSQAIIAITDALEKNMVWGTLPQESYDRVCSPSWIIQSNIQDGDIYGTECEGYDTNSIYL